LKCPDRSRGNLRQKAQRPRSPGAVHWDAQLRALGLAAFLTLVCVTPSGAQTNPSGEYQLKAAFLLNFAKFIEWPQNAFQGDKTPIVVCVFRYDPFGSALDEILRGKNINNRELLARRINELPEVKACQLVFISEREEKRLPDILNSLNGASVLVVGEGGEFAERGGGVQFFLEADKLRFAVNVDAVQRARLSVNSRLLALARIVHDQRHPKGN
jgi:hypothetical protein